MADSILIVDEHVLFRQGLRSLFEHGSRFEVVGETSDAETTVQLATQLRPDVVILSTTLPGLDTDETIRRITAGNRAARVMATSLFLVASIARKAFRAGAHGFVLKTCSFEELLVGVEQVLKGKPYMDRKVATELLRYHTEPATATDSSIILTSREIEVLRLLANGKGTRETARELSISEEDVHTHRSQIMRKLGLVSVAELTKYAIREGLTSI